MKVGLVFARREESLVGDIIVEEATGEINTHLIRSSPYGRSDGGADARAGCAELLHGHQG